MSNVFITIKNIARETLMALKENIVMPQLCYRDFSGDFTENGATIQVKRPPKFTANDFTHGNSVVNQDIQEESVPVTLNHLATVDVSWGTLEAAVNVGEQKVRDLVITPASYALAKKINHDGLNIYRQMPNRLGTAGTTPSAISDIAAARLFLNKAEAPEANRVAIWNADADSSLVQIDNLRKVNEAGQNKALREGEIGRVLGIDNYMSQGVATHTPGALTAGGTGATGAKVKTAVTNGATVVLVSNASASATLTGSLKAGDNLTIGAGATAVKCVVAEDATADSNEIEVTLLTKVTVAANDAVAVGSGYAGNLVFHKNAIAFVNRPLVMPQGGAEGYVVTDPDSNLALRVTRGYDITTKTNKMSLDILYGYALVYPELAAVFMG